MPIYKKELNPFIRMGLFILVLGILILPLLKLKKETKKLNESNLKLEEPKVTVENLYGGIGFSANHKNDSRVVEIIKMQPYIADNEFIPDSIRLLSQKPKQGYTEFGDPILLEVHEDEMEFSRISEGIRMAFDKGATHIFIEFLKEKQDKGGTL